MKNSKKNPHGYYVEVTDERLFLNQTATYLRDIADTDYIASRTLHRSGLLPQSAYFAHQSMEKYFKAILLFMGENTRPLGHNLIELQKKASELNVILNETSLFLINELEGIHNSSRYLSDGFHIDRTFLFRLDCFVKDIRPYVQGRAVTKEEFIDHNIHRIGSGYDRNSCKILMSGKLEKILKSTRASDKELIKNLTWENVEFYIVNKPLPYRGGGSYSVNFPHDLSTKKGIKNAKLVNKYFKFEYHIEKFLKSGLSLDKWLLKNEEM